MGQQIGLGAVVGVVVGLMCWRGNQSANVVSTFPDALTLVVLVILLSVAVRFDASRRQARGRSASLRAGLTVGAAAGVVFGGAVAGLGAIRFSNPTIGLLAFGFLTALGFALACSVVAAVPRSASRRARVAER
jgi:hypothetical protein